MPDPMTPEELATLDRQVANALGESDLGYVHPYSTAPAHLCLMVAKATEQGWTITFGQVEDDAMVWLERDGRRRLTASDTHWRALCLALAAEEEKR